MKSKTTSAIVLSLFFLMAGFGSARAALTMRVSIDNGTNWTVVEDNGPLDAAPSTGSNDSNGPKCGGNISHNLDILVSYGDI